MTFGCVEDEIGDRVIREGAPGTDLQARNTRG
jgi:hypothetical protein